MCIRDSPSTHPLIVHVAQAAAIESWATGVPPEAYRLAAAFWPGPLTLVLKRSPRAANLLPGPGGVAVESVEKVLERRVSRVPGRKCRGPGLLPSHYAPRAGILLAEPG